MTTSSTGPGPNSAARAWLLALARASLAERIDVPFPLPPRPEDLALLLPARAFVSWYLDGRIVGCMGTLEPRPSLVDAVRHFAVQAALHDPRSVGVEADQFDRLRAEISILSEPAYLDAQGLSAIADALVAGDGVIVRLWSHKAIFLPAAWESFPDPHRFLVALCNKAGIDSQRDGEKVSAWTFSTETFGDLPDEPAHGTPAVR